MRQHMFLGALEAVLCAALLATCSDSGDSGDSQEAPGNPYCRAVDRELESLDAPSVTGKTAGEVLDETQGAYLGQVDFYASEGLPGGGTVRHALAGQSSALTFDLKYDGGPIVDHQATALQYDPAAACTNALSIEVRLGLESDDGALDEQLVLSLGYKPYGGVAGSRGYSVGIAYDPDAFPAGLDVADLTLPDGAEFQSVVMNATMLNDELQGWMYVSYRLSGAGYQVVFAGFSGARAAGP